ncbi:MAG: hypothetical protein J0M07_03815 [Anaerolineae bacterium]|nr:hypothetical protein [Anaerolineae bacterium]
MSEELFEGLLDNIVEEAVEEPTPAKKGKGKGKEAPKKVMVPEITVYEPFVGIPTGSLEFDYAISGRGLPRGSVTYISGPKGAGKTALAIMTCVSAIQQRLKVAVLNPEGRWNVAYARDSGMGIPGKDYRLYVPETLEDALNLTDDLIENEQPDVLVIDCVAAMPSRVEHNGTLEDEHMGKEARTWSKYFRNRIRAIARHHTAVLLLNQFRDKIGSYTGGNTRPGGNALDHYCSVGIDLRTPDYHYDNEADAKARRNPYGMRTSGSSWKNSLCQPQRPIEVELFLVPELSVNKLAEVVAFGKRYRVLTSKEGGPVAGGYHFYEGKPLGASKDETIATLASDLELMRKIEGEILSAMKGR